MRFKNFEGKPKETISATGGFGTLQIVSEPNTERCASEEADPRRGLDTRRCASKDAGPKRGWIGDPTSIGERNKCQRGCWASKRSGL